MGIDEIYRGNKGKFLTVVCNLETREPLWFGKDRKQETLDEYFRSQLVSRQRKRIEAACVDMWEPFRLGIERWAPQCKIVYDKFHILQHANDAIDEVRKPRVGDEPSSRIKTVGVDRCPLVGLRTCSPRFQSALDSATRRARMFRFANCDSSRDGQTDAESICRRRVYICEELSRLSWWGMPDNDTGRAD